MPHAGIGHDCPNLTAVWKAAGFPTAPTELTCLTGQASTYRTVQIRLLITTKLSGERPNGTRRCQGDPP
jgi:hypothetical protein